MKKLQRFADNMLKLVHGRSTAFFIMFFVVGNVMAYLGKLTPTYVAFIATLGGLVLGHSIKEDVLPQTGEDNAK